MLAVHPSNPAKDLKEFLANAKDKSFTYGSAGLGTGPQIGAEYFFKEVAKVKYVHVPFQGGAPAITALLGNHVDSIVLTLPPITPHIRSGALRGLGVASRHAQHRRSRTCRPTARWAIRTSFGSWVGVFAPAKTPDAVVAKLNAEINAVIKEPDSLRAARQGRLRSGRKERRRGQRLFQETRSSAGPRWSRRSAFRTERAIFRVMAGHSPAKSDVHAICWPGSHACASRMLAA